MAMMVIPMIEGFWEPKKTQKKITAQASQQGHWDIKHALAYEDEEHRLVGIDNQIRWLSTPNL